MEFFSFRKIGENHKEKSLVKKVTVVVALDLGTGNTKKLFLACGYLSFGIFQVGFGRIQFLLSVFDFSSDIFNLLTGLMDYRVVTPLRSALESLSKGQIGRASCRERVSSPV